MYATRSATSKSCLTRALVWVLVFDLLALAATGLEWLGLGLTTPGVFLGLTLARVPVWALFLHRLMQPVRRWEQTPAPQRSDALALDTDLALQRLPARFALVYTGAWVGCELLIVALGLARVPADAPPLGRAELLTALLLAGSLILPLRVVFIALMRRLLLEVQTRVSTLLRERGLVSRSPPTSIDATTVGFATAILVGTILSLAGFGSMWGIYGLREAALAEQRHLVELGALRLSHEFDAELPPTVELVSLDALPTPLAAALAAEPSTSAAEYDVARGVAVAAVSLGGDRALVSRAAAEEQLEEFALLIALMTVLVVPVVWFSARLNARAISRPLEEFHAALQSFTERGELRALERIVPLHNDELGRLAREFNTTLDILEELAGAAEAVAEGDLNIELERPGELHDAFRGMVRRLGEIVSELRETSLELAGAATEIHGLTLRQTESAHEQAASVEQVNASVGSLSTAASRIASTARAVLDDAERALETSDLMVEKIGGLRRQTGEIGELLDAIRTIAERSDLLALNGSLEAVRAGEAGRGFALVAAEMRRLAEQVAGTLDDVREQVTRIETAGASTAEATAASRALSQRTAEAARKISKLTHEQSEDTGQASQGMQQVAGMVANTATATSQTQATAEGLRAQAERLQGLLRGFETGD